MTTSAYTRIVSQMRVLTNKDAEGRFRIGELVGKALDAGGTITSLIEDVGLSRTTLNNYLEASDFWGSDRMPPGDGGRATPWSCYQHVAAYAKTLDECSADELKARFVKGGRDDYDEWSRALYAAARARQPISEDPHKHVRSSFANAAYHLASACDTDEYPPLTSYDRRQLRKYLDSILESARELGIITAPAVRKGRAA